MDNEIIAYNSTKSNDVKKTIEKLKLNQLKWTKLMNNYKNVAKGIILNELIYM